MTGPAEDALVTLYHKKVIEQGEQLALDEVPDPVYSMMIRVRNRARPECPGREEIGAASVSRPEGGRSASQGIESSGA